MEIVKYPDGSSYVKASYNTEHPSITFRLNSYEDLWHLHQFIDCLNAQGMKPMITIPNLIDAQADRRFNHNESSGLKLVCNFLAKMDAHFKIFHPHNPEVVEALMDNVSIIDNTDFINKVLLYLITEEVINNKPNSIDDNLTLMSADAGGYKPLLKLCENIDWGGETSSASKYRSVVTEDGKITSKLQQFVGTEDFKGQDILIVDDICVHGGTFKGLAKILATKNIGKLYLAVSHMTVQHHKDAELFHLFDKVFVTNSKYDNYFIPNKKKDGGVQPENLEIIKLF